MTTQVAQREYMNIVTVGHVDHGKSTVVGRLLADTNSLPEGKLEAIRAQCAREQKVFEYAFLLDALKAEQSQGITIDTARCFFKTDKRNYIINDAPGHIEFLKNMVTGAARAEAALLVIDSHEGIQENSKRHGYLLSMLGIKQIAVLVNKMDLVDYSQEVFETIERDYTAFLTRLSVEPLAFIPIGARDGVNIASINNEVTPWYDGLSVLEQIDAFDRGTRTAPADEIFRMPVQDIYKFTGSGDDRRIIAGTIETGEVSVGDEVIFLPSGKRTRIKSIEGFSTEPRETISRGWATGFQMTEQIYIKPGELMCRADQTPAPLVGTRLRANIFWMGRAPLVMDKIYKLKIGATNVGVQLAEIQSVLDASELATVENKQQVDRHDVGEVILETTRPVAFDERNVLEQTGRFAIVDDHEISGAGVVLESADAEGESLLSRNISRREFAWQKGLVTSNERTTRNRHAGKFIVLTGRGGNDLAAIARQLERDLFDRAYNTYYLGIGNLFGDLADKNAALNTPDRDTHLEQLGELARILTDAGTLFITTVHDVDDFDLAKLKLLIEPGELFVVGESASDFVNFKIDVELGKEVDVNAASHQIIDGLDRQNIILDYVI